MLHDPLCPLTPPAFLAGCVAHAAATGQVVVAVREVTDTVKTVTDGYVGPSVDRDGLLQVVSPVVLPAAVVAALDGVPSTDLAALVAVLAQTFPVDAVAAPAAARRVLDEDDLAVLEVLSGPAGQQPGPSAGGAGLTAATRPPRRPRRR